MLKGRNPVALSPWPLNVPCHRRSVWLKFSRRRPSIDCSLTSLSHTRKPSALLLFHPRPLVPYAAPPPPTCTFFCHLPPAAFPTALPSLFPIHPRVEKKEEKKRVRPSCQRGLFLSLPSLSLPPSSGLCGAPARQLSPLDPNARAAGGCRRFYCLLVSRRGRAKCPAPLLRISTAVALVEPAFSSLLFPMIGVETRHIQLAGTTA